VNRRAIAIGAAIVALVACRSADPPRVPPVVRDSAGVSIVENVVPEWSERTRWRLAETPELNMGGSERDTTQHFVRLRGLHQMRSGSIVVVDDGDPSVHFYDRKGTLINAVGRRGNGPGELPDRVFGRTFSCATDSVFVQVRPREMAIFVAPGSYMRTIRLATPTGSEVGPVGCLGDRIVGASMFSLLPKTDGIYRDSVRLSLHSTSGEYIGEIDTLPVHDATYRMQSEGMGYHPTPFGGTLVRVIGRNTIVTGFGGTFEIETRDERGTLRSIARVAGRERPITAADRYRYVEFIVSRGPAELAATSRAFLKNEFDMPGAMTTLPAFAQLRIDGLGNIWAREYDFLDAIVFMNRQTPMGPPRLRDEPSRWTILSPDGRLLGDLVAPPRFQIHEIGDDWVLGVWRDDLDVEHVQRYGLVKPGS